MMGAAIIIAPIVVVWLLARWLFAPMRPPVGYDEPPLDWDEEAVRRAMRGENEDAR